MCKPNRSSSPHTFLDRHFWRIFASIWLAVALPFFIAGLSILWRDRGIEQRFLSEARDVTGKVLVKSRSVDSPQRYTVSYRYILSAGQKRYGSSRVSLAQWESLTELGPLPVRYLASDDQRSRIPGAMENTMLGPAFAIVGGVLSLAGLYLLLRK